jgi:hypothetical protein
LLTLSFVFLLFSSIENDSKCTFSNYHFSIWNLIDQIKK